MIKMRFCIRRESTGAQEHGSTGSIKKAVMFDEIDMVEEMQDDEDFDEELTEKVDADSDGGMSFSQFVQGVEEPGHVPSHGLGAEGGGRKSKGKKANSNANVNGNGNRDGGISPGISPRAPQLFPSLK